MAGGGSGIPSSQELLSAGVVTFNEVDDTIDTHSKEEDLSRMLSKKLVDSTGAESNLEPVQPLVSSGSGIAVLPKKLVAKILANKYIDFAELPPARGKSKTMSQTLDGQIIVVQAADLVQVRKIIPDLATWLQCYSLYVAMLVTHYPMRISE